jgi:hypothetical protein
MEQPWSGGIIYDIGGPVGKKGCPQITQIMQIN